MSESQAHKNLKKMAKNILKEKGFSKDEMKEEYHIKNMRIDFVGIKRNFKVAIECGNLQGRNRIMELSNFFDEIVHLPYLDDKCREIKTLSIFEPTFHRLGKHKKFLRIGMI